MVTGGAGRMAQRLIGLVSVLAALAPAHGAEARPSAAPDIALCNAFPSDPEALGDREGALALPADWASMAMASRGWIAVKTEFDSTYCVDTGWMSDGKGFEGFGTRFLGFAWEGTEAFGYILIDRAGQGRAIDTGARPVFSPDGSRFAALQRSDANARGFEGFAIWQVHDNALNPYIVNAGPPLHPMHDWRVDRWEGGNCLHISAVAYESFGGDWERLPSAPRSRFVASAAKGWQIGAGQSCPRSDAR